MIDKLLGEHPEYFGYAILGAFLLFFVFWIIAAMTKGQEDDKAMAAIWDRIMKLLGRGGGSAVLAFSLLTSGCAGGITSDGLLWSIGDAVATTCPDVPVGILEGAEQPEGASEPCSTAQGGEVSEAGGSLLQAVLSPITLLLRLLGGLGG